VRSGRPLWRPDSGIDALIFRCGSVCWRNRWPRGANATDCERLRLRQQALLATYVVDSVLKNQVTGLEFNRIVNVRFRRKVFSAVSWRIESRASSLPIDRGQRVRQRCGRMMEIARAHNSLPDIAHRAAILCFHGIVAHEPDPDVEHEALHVPKFRRLLRVLQRSFNVISLAELVSAIREGNSPPPRSIVITFDDGYVTNYTVAAEVLAAFKMPWSTFLPAEIIEKGSRQWIDDLYLLIHRGSQRRIRLRWGDDVLPFDLNTSRQRGDAVFRIRESCRYMPEAIRRLRMRQIYELYSQDELQYLRAKYPSFAPMTWAQARELQSAGVDVGSHGMTHIALAPQPPEVIRYELLAARELLQQRIGEHSPHFSYPYGQSASISQETETQLAQMGYHCALSLEQNVVHCRQQNLMRLPRLIVSASVGRVLFGLWQRFIR